MEHKGYEIREDLSYHVEHCWVRFLDDDHALVGWSDFAQKLAAEISSVLVPDEGGSVKMDEFMGTIETGKWVGKLYSPLTGTIVEINEDVIDEPQSVNNDPFGDGWIMKVKLSDPSEKDKLLDAEGYKRAIDAKLEELDL